MKKIISVENNCRLTELLASSCIGLSSARISSQIKRGEARVNGKKVYSDVRLVAGDSVSFFIPEGMEREVCSIYADENVAVVDKPAHTDVEIALTNRMKELYGYACPLHRLDRNTTGLVAFALNDGAYGELSLAFKERRVEKAYVAQTVGRVKDGIYEAFLLKDADMGRVHISDTQRPGYKWIKTEVTFTDGSWGNGIFLARIRLYTGRTHQIRAHLAHLGCPVLGDDKYGDREANKKYGQGMQRLRSTRLSFCGLKPPFDYLNGKVFVTEEDYID